MREPGLEGAVRGQRKRTSLPGEPDERPADLVERNFRAPAPNRLWVADLTYVSTWSGFCYVALIVDVFSRAIVGWRVSSSLHAEVALDGSPQNPPAFAVARFRGPTTASATQTCVAEFE